MIQVNGFFENTSLGVSEDTPLKLWSTKISLREYLEMGAANCLKTRLLSSSHPDLDDDSSLSSFDRLQTNMQPISPDPLPDPLPEEASSRTLPGRIRFSLKQLRRPFKQNQSIVTEPPPSIRDEPRSGSLPGSSIPQIRILGAQRGTTAESEDENSSGYNEQGSSPRQSM